LPISLCSESIQLFVKLIILCILCIQAFGWFALVAYFVDLVFAIIDFRKSRVQRSSTTTTQQETTTTTRY